MASAVILTLDQVSAVLAQCAVEFKKKSSACSLEHAWTMIIKQKFSPMHTLGSRVTESKKQSNLVKSGQKLHCAVTALWWTQIFLFTTRDIRTARAFEITNKKTKSQNHHLTSINSTKSPCSKVLKYPRNCRLYATLILKGKKILNWLMYTSMAPMKKKD